MSRRPGIASGWFDRFSSDVYPSDSVVIRGREMRPPRYYDNKYKLLFPLDFEEIQFQRQLDAEKHLDNCTKDRLEIREQVQIARLNKLPRELDHDS